MRAAPTHDLNLLVSAGGPTGLRADTPDHEINRQHASGGTSVPAANQALWRPAASAASSAERPPGHRPPGRARVRLPPNTTVSGCGIMQLEVFAALRALIPAFRPAHVHASTRHHALQSFESGPAVWGRGVQLH